MIILKYNGGGGAMSDNKAILKFILFIISISCLVQTASAQTLLESSMEIRFQLDLQVPEDALMRHVPEGWTLDIRDAGNAKDANLRVIFIERVSINGPDGSAAGEGTNLLVYLAAPTKDPAGNSTQLIIGGITADPNDVPGPFGVYIPATTHSLSRITNFGSGPVIETQYWALETATGEHMKLNISFERGTPSLRPARDRLYCSGEMPATCQLAKQQQMLEVLKNVTTNPRDRVRAYTFSAGGGRYADLFDGTEKLLSWDNILWVKQEIYTP
jgi:hypothetical protein